MPSIAIRQSPEKRHGGPFGTLGRPLRVPWRRSQKGAFCARGLQVSLRIQPKNFVQNERRCEARMTWENAMRSVIPLLLRPFLPISMAHAVDRPDWAYPPKQQAEVP